MTSALATKRQRVGKNLGLVILVALAAIVATVGVAPVVFLIWLLKTIQHWLVLLHPHKKATTTGSPPDPETVACGKARLAGSAPGLFRSS